MPTFLNEPFYLSEELMIIKKKRKHTFVYEEENDKLKPVSFTFDFPFAENKDYSFVRKEMQTVKDSKTEVSEGNALDLLEGSLENIAYFNCRKALIDCAGVDFEIENEDGSTYTKEAKVKNPDGTINEESQKFIFEAAINLPGIAQKVIDAYNGITSKNLKGGVTPPSTSDGTPPSA